MLSRDKNRYLTKIARHLLRSTFKNDRSGKTESGFICDQVYDNSSACKSFLFLYDFWLRV